MSLIQASSAILQGTLYTLGKINDQHYLWSGNDSPILQRGLCEQPELFEYSNRLVAICQSPFPTSFLTHKDGIWEPDSALNREAPTLQDGASITKAGDRLVLIGGRTKNQKTSVAFQFYNQNWERIYSSEIQPELPPFEHHSATLAKRASYNNFNRRCFSIRLDFQNMVQV
ncbi:hypothetical protein DSO57_1033417 [Entomophthora muscae]|uniref:Uncharacterized protein n=1 Tax=Entomophthora muscae TaxID=34485 RepID=A0ACC2TY86_9FUNG|nr:hypothetical protein DSO57_1033417 [Entomophthora muscae]